MKVLFGQDRSGCVPSTFSGSGDWLQVLSRIVSRIDSVVAQPGMLLLYWKFIVHIDKGVLQNLLNEHMQKERKETFIVVLWFEWYHMFINQLCVLDIFEWYHMFINQVCVLDIFEWYHMFVNQVCVLEIFPFIIKSCFLTSRQDDKIPLVDWCGS